MTPRPCIEPGCPYYAIGDRARCRKHDRERRKDGTLTGARGTSREWERARREALRRSDRRCSRCYAVWPLDVHHMDGDPFNHDQANLEVLCQTCHREVH